MGSLLSTLKEIFNNVFQINQTPSEKNVYAPELYNPLKGASVAGMINSPKVNLQPYFTPPPKNIDMILPAGEKITLRPEYKNEFVYRKQQNFNSATTPFLQEERYRVFMEKKYNTINGNIITSREPFKAAVPTNWFEKVSRLSNPC